MAVAFKYNKSSLHELGKQLKVRETALPTLKNKEAALRLEVRKEKQAMLAAEARWQRQKDEVAHLETLWVELAPAMIRIRQADIAVRLVAGVRVPALKSVTFERQPFSRYHEPAWFTRGLEVLEALATLQLERDIHERAMLLLDFARKKTSQKVNLYEKVQIPEYREAMGKIRRYLEDEENLGKSAQKILKRRKEAASEQS